MALDNTAVNLDQVSDEELDSMIAELEQQVSPEVTEFSSMSDEEINREIENLETQQALSFNEEEQMLIEEVTSQDTASSIMETSPAEPLATEEGKEADWTDIAKDMTIQTMSGIREALINGAHTILPLYGVEPPKKEKQMFVDPTTTAGQVTKDLSRFLTGYTIYGAPIKGIGAATSAGRYVKAFVEGSTRGFVGDYAVTSDEDKNLAALAKEHGYDNFLTTALAINEKDTLSTKKFKGALEGVLLGTILEGVSLGYRSVKGAVQDSLAGGGKGASALTREIDKDIAAAFTPRQKVVMTDEGHLLLAPVKNIGAQEVMDDLQTAKIEHIVDAKMDKLSKARAEWEESFGPDISFSELRDLRTNVKKETSALKAQLKQTEKKILSTKKELEEATKDIENLEFIKGDVSPVPEAHEVLKAGDEDITSSIPTFVMKDKQKLSPEGAAILAGNKAKLDRQQAAISLLDDLHVQRLDLEDQIDTNEAIISGIKDDVQQRAAFRKREALRITSPYPEYHHITVDDLDPIASKIDPSTKSKNPRAIRPPLQRLPKDTPHVTNEYDAVIFDLIHVPRPVKAVADWMRDVGATLILRSADSLKSIADVSPTAARLSNMIRFDTSATAKKAGNYSYTESAQFLAGQTKAQFKDALLKHLDDTDRNMFGSLTEEANKHISRALRGIDLDNIPKKYKDTANDIRKVLDDFFKKSDEEAPTGFIDDFFPRKWRPAVIHKNFDKFKRKMKAAGKSDAEIDEIKRKIVNEMNEDLGVVKKFTHDKDYSWKGSKLLSGGSRSLDIDELDFEEFLENDVINVLDDYFDKGARKITYNQMFGYDGSKALAMVEQITKEAREAGRPLLERETVAIQKLLRNIQGGVKLGNAWDGVNEYVGSAMRFAHLGLATLISFGEAFIPYGKVPATTATKGLIKAVSSLPRHYVSKVMKNVPEAEAYAAAQRVNLALDAAASERIASLLGGDILYAANRKVNTFFFKGTLLTEWVKLLQVASYHTGRSLVVDNLTDLAKGVSKVKASRLRKELEELGVDVKSGIKWVKGGKSPDHPFIEMIDRGALRFANDSAIHPDASVKPFIQSTPEARLLTQFKQYPTAFANVIMRDWAEGIFGPITKTLKGELTKGEAAYQSATKAVRVSTAIALILGATHMGMELKDYIWYGEDGNPNVEKNLEGTDYLIELLDRSGTIGHAAPIKHMYDADRYNQEPGLAVFGPAVGTALDLIEVGVETFKDQNVAQDKAAKLLTSKIPNWLPTEVAISLMSNDGSKSAREQVRRTLSAIDNREDKFEPEEFKPQKFDTPKGVGDINLFEAVKDMFDIDLFSESPDVINEDGPELPEEDVQIDEKASQIGSKPLSGGVPRIFSDAEGAPVSPKDLEFTGIQADLGKAEDFYTHFYATTHEDQEAEAVQRNFRNSVNSLITDDLDKDQRKNLLELEAAVDKGLEAFDTEIANNNLNPEEVKQVLRIIYGAETRFGKLTKADDAGSGHMQIGQTTFESLLGRQIGPKAASLLGTTVPELREIGKDDERRNEFLKDIKNSAMFALATIFQKQKTAQKHNKDFFTHPDIQDAVDFKEEVSTTVEPSMPEVSKEDGGTEENDESLLVAVNSRRQDEEASERMKDILEIKKAFPDASFEELEAFFSQFEER